MKTHPTLLRFLARPISGLPTRLATYCLLLFAGTFLLSSCVTEDAFDDTQKGNFEALWKIMDEHYCFFEEKASTGTRFMRSTPSRWTKA